MPNTTPTFIGNVTEILAYVNKDEDGNVIDRALQIFAKNETGEENAYVRFNSSIVKHGEFAGRDWTAKELARLGKLLECDATFEAIALNVAKIPNTEVSIAYGERDDKDNPGQKLPTKRIYFTGLGEKRGANAVPLTAWA